MFAQRGVVGELQQLTSNFQFFEMGPRRIWRGLFSLTPPLSRASPPSPSTPSRRKMMAMLSQSNRARVCAFAENRIARPPATRKTQPRMSRPGNILSLGMLIAAALLTLPQDHAAPRPTTPNLLQILTDDQGWGDLHCFGHPYIQSPNLDRLAAEGIKFTHCYAADSVCSPSRSAILT